MLYEVKTLQKLAIPLIAALLSQKAMQFIDTVMIGALGPRYLAAAALGMAMFFAFLSFCGGTLSAVGIFIVRAKAANDDNEITHYLQQGIYAAFLLALPAIILMGFVPHILINMGEDPHVVANSRLFLHGMMWGFPGYLLFLVFRELVSAFLLTRVVMCITLIAIPLTWLVNYTLIYGKFGLPQLGLAGVGYSCSIILWFMFFAMLFYCKRQPLLKQYITLRSFKVMPARLKAIFALGLPSGAIITLDTSMFLATTLMMGYVSITALAAHQIAIQVVGATYSVFFALAMAVALQVGYYAAEQMPQAKRFAYTGLSLTAGISGLLALLLMLFADNIAKWYIANTPDNQALIQSTILFIRISALFQCFDALQVVINGILKGLKDTFVPMLISVICYWCIGIVSAYYFAFHTHLGAAGLWYGLTLGICSVAVVLMIRLGYRLRAEQVLYFFGFLRRRVELE